MGKLYTPSKTDSVQTPQLLMDYITKTYGECFDPVPFNENFNPKIHTDGLKIDWSTTQWNYINPPYSNIGPFVRKACMERDERGCQSIVLVKTDTLSTNYFAECSTNVNIVIIKKHLTFKGYTRRARFGSVLLIFPKTTDITNNYSVLEL